MIMDDWLTKAPQPVRKSLRRLALAALRGRDKISGKRSKIIFILAHMRSGSTLLSHILMSHPDVLGYGERNAAYHNKIDLDHLIIDVTYHRRRPFHIYPFILDQINHTTLLTDAHILHQPHVYTIFLIREPEASLTSMVNVLGQFHGFTQDQALAHYTERLPALVHLSQNHPDPAHTFCLTYSDIVKRTKPTLTALQTFLQLGSPLSAKYKQFSFTGKRGDPSHNIFRGHIHQTPANPLLDLPVSQRIQLQNLYTSCHHQLQTNCQAGGNT